jgi:hypothetical protein
VRIDYIHTQKKTPRQSIIINHHKEKEKRTKGQNEGRKEKKRGRRKHNALASLIQTPRLRPPTSDLPLPTKQTRQRLFFLGRFFGRSGGGG